MMLAQPRSDNTIMEDNDDVLIQERMSILV